MFELVKAVLAGILSIIVRKLGPTIILFFYIWVHHSKFYTHLGQEFQGVPLNVWLAACAIGLGFMSLAFKDQVANLSRLMDRKAKPFLHSWVLRHVNGGDLLVLTIQRSSLELLVGLKSASVFLILVLFAALTFPVFALVLLAVFGAVFALSWHASHHPIVQANASFFTRLRIHPEYYAEILVGSGLIIAFMAMATEKSLINGTMLILIVARFSNEIKVVAKNLVALLRTRRQVEKTWQNRADAAARRQAREAEAEARKNARQAEAEVRRLQRLAAKASQPASEPQGQLQGQDQTTPKGHPPGDPLRLPAA